MIYSRYRPDTGLYDYFASPERVGLGDDLPVPQLSTTSPIGVPSTEVGRSAPAALSFVGRGTWARGQILPLDRTGLGSTTIGWPSFSPLVWLGLGVLGGYLLARRRL